MTSPAVNDPPLTLDSIDAGVAMVEAKAQPDAKDVIERKDTELEAARLKNKLARSQIKNVKADRTMRKAYASRILRYLECYSGGVGLILLVDGFGLIEFDLPAEVLATLVGSTAIAAIGLVGFIARGLFKSPSE